MLKELLTVNARFIDKVKMLDGISGAWYFGSIQHNTHDEHSDIDIVLLIEDRSFSEFDLLLPHLLADTCEQVVLCWAEDFNSHAIKNYDFLLRLGDMLFQYDVFLLNDRYLDDFICQIHYSNLSEKDIIFSKDGKAESLLKTAPTGSLWNEDIHRTVETYWLHVFMSAKYFSRRDFFKLNAVLRTLMDSHTSMLLTAYDCITWGGSASKLHFIPEEKQKHLMKYGCIEDFAIMRENLRFSIASFISDMKEICSADPDIPRYISLAETITQYWLEQTARII